MSARATSREYGGIERTLNFNFFNSSFLQTTVWSRIVLQEQVRFGSTGLLTPNVVLKLVERVNVKSVLMVVVFVQELDPEGLLAIKRASA